MVNGACVGLGLTIALLCDSVVVADDAKLGDTHVDLGLVAGDGAAVVLPILVGPHRAKELLLAGRLVTGTEAVAMGIGNYAVPTAELHDVTYRLAHEFAAQPVYAARATKMVLNRYVRAMADQILDTSLAYEAISRTLPEYPEAVEAWKRRQATRRDTTRDHGGRVSNQPLRGIRVIDLGTRIAAPFAATTLAELGADVIKVEDPGTGDMLRELGPFADGRSLYFGVEDRSRRNVTCNLRVEPRAGAVPPPGRDRRRGDRELPSRHPRTLEHRSGATPTAAGHRPDLRARAGRSRRRAAGARSHRDRPRRPAGHHRPPRPAAGEVGAWSWPTTSPARSRRKRFSPRCSGADAPGRAR